MSGVPIEPSADAAGRAELGEAAPTGPDPHVSWPDPGYAWYVVAVLAVANTFAFIDRSILSLLIQPIQDDLGVNDTLMGLLHGFSFVIFYTFLGFPIAWLADRYNRRNIIVAGIAVWSAMTVACGFARGYWQLFLARIGVGAGEAALSPAAYSMMADYFPPRQLPKAMSVFAVGIYVGNGAALIMGGAVIGILTTFGDVALPVVGVLRPWQLAFVAVGLPGLLIALWLATVREPRRRSAGRVTAELSQAGIRDVAAYFLRRRRAYLAIFAGFSLLILLGYGNSTWVPTFLVRTYGMTIRDVGVEYGLVVLVTGTGGAVAGGWFASWLAGTGRRDANLIAGLLGALVIGPAWIALAFAPSVGWALAVLGIVNFASAFPFGGGYASIQDLTPNRMRAQMAAAFLICVNLVGVGLGPTVVGAITDFALGDAALVRYSLAIAAAIFAPAAAAALYSGLRPYRDAKLATE